jgi:hypothetical protein
MAAGTTTPPATPWTPSPARSGDRLRCPQVVAEPPDEGVVGADHVPGYGPAQRRGGGQGAGERRVAAGQVGLPASQPPLELLGRACGARRAPRIGRRRGGSRLGATGQVRDRQAGGQLELQHGPAGVARQLRGVVEGVAAQQAQHRHLPLRVAKPPQRLDGVPWRAGRRVLAGGGTLHGVTGHRDQPGPGLALATGGRRQPARRAPEHLPGQLGRLRAVARPGEQVAEDAVDLLVVDPDERLAVAGRGPVEQGRPARGLGGQVAVPAGAGGRLGVRRTVGLRCHGGL